MNNEIDENAQLDVKISDLHATAEELEKLKHLIAINLGKNVTPLKITFISNDAKGSRYEVKFRVLNPRHFNIRSVEDWLYETKLVGWYLESTFVRP